MQWYDKSEAPFREGKKRKEFPDAFAVAMIDSYAQKTGKHVAVVSGDNDFKLACARFGRLLHFASLPRLTEVLLSDDQRVATVRAALEEHKQAIESAVLDDAPWVTCRHANDRFEVKSVSFLSSELVDMSVVAIGDSEVTITFVCALELEAELQWEESDEEGGYQTHVREVNDTIVVTGAAKASFRGDAGAFSGISLLEFDDLEAELSVTPGGIWF